MSDFIPIPPNDADKLAADLVSRLPPALCPTDDDRARLTDSLSDFLAQCSLANQSAQDASGDQDNSKDR